MFDKLDSGKRIREEGVVGRGAVERVTSKKRMPQLRVEGSQNHDEEKRGHAQEEMRSRRQSDRQLAHRFGHHEAKCIQSRTSVENMFILDMWIWVPVSRTKQKAARNDAEGQSQKEQVGFDSSIRSVRRCRAKNSRVYGSYS